MMTIKIDGLQKLARKLDQTARDKAVKLGLDQGAQLLKGWIQQNRLTGPRPQYLGVVTGRLRTSIATKPTEKRGDSYVAKIGTNVEYAAVHEFGFPERNIPARPFMRPSLEDPKNQESIVSILSQRISEAIARA